MARRALCACPGCCAIPEGAGSAGVGVLGALLRGGYPEGRGEALSGFVRAHLCCCHRFATLPWEIWVENRAWRWGTGIQMGQERL